MFVCGKRISMEGQTKPGSRLGRIPRGSRVATFLKDFLVGSLVCPSMLKLKEKMRAATPGLDPAAARQIPIAAAELRRGRGF